LLVADFLLKNGYASADFIDPVRIAPGHAQKAQPFGHLAGHLVFRVRNLAVEDLHPVHVAKNGPLASLFHIHLQLGDAKEKKSPERMGRNH
jgi:hypothetical protein